MFEKNLALNELYDLYAPLLSEKKRRVFELYYGEDLSLFEISQELSVSRQGVRDLLNRTAGELVCYEEGLGLAAKRKQLRAFLKGLEEAVSPCEEAVKNKVSSIKEELLSLFGM